VSTPPRVLFVSKPVVPPYHDGTKCLVRDVATNLELVHPLVMATPGAAPLPGVEFVPVYRDSGSYSPALAENARAAFALVARRDADLWHFVFAPNPKSSAVGRALRRVLGKRVVQTVASPPRSFDAADSLLFGDVVVAQSRDTRTRLLAHAPARRIEVIPPPVPMLHPRTHAEKENVRERLLLPEGGPLYVYPGDIELGGGAEHVARMVEPLVRSEPDAIVVFAYRAKTPRAAGVARELEQRLPARHVRLCETLPDVLALIERADAVLFPVEDLWGKVDMPIVLLESMRLGVPVVVLARGPLSEIAGALSLPSPEPESWVRLLTLLRREPGYAESVREAGKLYVAREHDARVVARRYEELYVEVCARPASRARRA